MRLACPKCKKSGIVIDGTDRKIDVLCAKCYDQEQRKLTYKTINGNNRMKEINYKLHITLVFIILIIILFLPLGVWLIFNSDMPSWCRSWMPLFIVCLVGIDGFYTIWIIKKILGGKIE